MTIKNAKTEDFERVYQFYLDVIEDMQTAEYRPGWQKDVYPTSDSIRGAIENGTLYYGDEDGEVIASFIINNCHEEAYDQCKGWQIDAKPEEITTIHTLAVSMKHQGKGMAGQLVTFAQEKARSEGQKAIRIDVLKGNVPAERLYPRYGFKHMDTVKIFYEDTGLADFLLYECVL